MYLLKENTLLFPGSLGHGSPGWTSAKDLSGESLYFSTRADDFPLCPVGVAGAHDRDRDDAFDASFAVDCHSEAVAKECHCASLWVNATSAKEEEAAKNDTAAEANKGSIATNQVGKFEK